MRTRYLAILAALALAAMACANFGADSGNGAEQDNNTDTNTENSTESSQILFEDDFSDDNSGWDRETYDTGLTDYENGGYRIYVSETNWSIWANPYKNFTDVIVEVDAQKIGGDDFNEFGIICRHRDVDNFYAVTISSDGFYAFLERNDGGDLMYTGIEEALESSAINQGAASNHILVECVGTRITLYVNGEFVAEIEDDSISSGDVGLYAGTFEEPGTDVVFDNFVVTRP